MNAILPPPRSQSKLTPVDFKFLVLVKVNGVKSSDTFQTGLTEKPFEMEALDGSWRVAPLTLV